MRPNQSHQAQRSPSAPPWMWPVLAVAAASAPFLRAFSLTSVFYLRDLALIFWPRHLWIRSSLLSGQWPLWDPYAAAGQAAFPDALNQLFLPPVALLRVLFPAVLGFNLIVSAPFPIAALGTWLFLRRHFLPTSATLGAIVFAASGPVVSTSNFPNLSWSVAWIPWLLWAVDRDRVAPSLRSFSLVVALAALQMLSGEPLTMMGTMALLLAYVTACAEEPSSSSRSRARTPGRVLGAVLAAGLVSAVQLVPMALAARASSRGLMRTDNLWSLHPVWLIESVLPHVFGDTFTRYAPQLPWINPLNSGREPFFYSLYVGPIVVLLSVLGALSGPRRWRLFWLAVAVISVLLACGEYTPVYPALQRMVPVLRSFRYPAKFFLFASFSCAMLAANAADALQTPIGARTSSYLAPWAVKTMAGTGLAAAIALVTLISLVIVAPFTGARAFYRLGIRLGVADPVAGAAFLFDTVPPIATRVLILLLTSALLAYLGWIAPREGRFARWLLFGLATAELLTVNIGLSPVLPAWRLGPPTWAAAVGQSAKRFYVGRASRGLPTDDDIDLSSVQMRPPQGLNVIEGRTVMGATLAFTPAAWGIRELLSYDLTELWPLEHARAVSRFARADRAGRLRFLARGGVRYCLLGSPPRPGLPPVQFVGESFGTLAVYDCIPDARRAYVVAAATVIPDVDAQLARLFDESFADGSTIMLDRPAPDSAGLPRVPARASARITSDGDDQVTIDATADVPGGFLVLLDSFDRNWHVEVDGQPAPLLRANALYRAVRIAPGGHDVRFTYRPVQLYVWSGVSGLAAFMLIALALKRPRHR